MSHDKIIAAIAAANVVLAELDIDLKTGGDGEYRYCMDGDPDRHTPDAPAMIARIVERFEKLS